ncbi:Nucleotide-binding universal stress protein, UspA family [Jannaschia faecimaris]|uniref:Nucleotide-binding universal stress protein, UspA family n=2 Tax=Jannaschia faecimaris TaxID=1244108 RepID=A0A1H3S8N3_9RHOB|nr:Nucleotide-binding universal stress protein, UspA family [Jannaschia faecimaris]
MTSVRHARKVANAFGGDLLLVQMLCGSADGQGPIDPVDWDIKKQRILIRLGLLTKGSEGNGTPCKIKLLEGECINQIKAFMELRRGDIAASPRSGGGMGWHSSETVWGVLSSRSAGILMIPDDAKIEPDTRYRRILVPLDGSSRAEAALPKATLLAKAETSEILLCYIAPEPGLTEFGSDDPEADRLHSLVRKRNDQAGRTYLAQIKKRLEHNGLNTSIKIRHGGDVRRALIDVILQDKADFVVMATHGQSGHGDVPTGDVARYVTDNADTPVLLVRCLSGRNGHHAFGTALPKEGRQPVGTD